MIQNNQKHRTQTQWGGVHSPLFALGGGTLWEATGRVGTHGPWTIEILSPWSMVCTLDKGRCERPPGELGATGHGP